MLAICRGRLFRSVLKRLRYAGWCPEFARVFSALARSHCACSVPENRQTTGHKEFSAPSIMRTWIGSADTDSRTRPTWLPLGFNSHVIQYLRCQRRFVLGKEVPVVMGHRLRYVSDGTAGLLV